MEDDPKIELESAALSLITAPFVLSCVSTIPPFQRSIELKQPVPGFGFETNPTAFEVPSIFGQKHASPSAYALGLFTYAPSRSAIKPIRPTI